MSSGVRNLRAMFENKDVSTSPPDRGRSPAGSVGPGSNGTSPRPLSKVRTSFVAVERSGQLGSQMGLKRENSGEPSLARRRTSFSISEEEHPEITAERKQSIASEFQARKNSTVIDETIPELAVETPTIEVDKQLGGDARSSKASSGGGLDLKKAAASNSTANAHSGKLVTTEKIVDKPSSSKFTARPTPISIANTSAPSKSSPKPTKSPAGPKTPKTPTTPRGRPKEPVKQSEPKVEKMMNKSAASHTSKPTNNPTASKTSSVASKTRIPPSPPQTGFVKPKPRSPTRPVKLPASLTAHTASSGSKGSAAPTASTRRSLSRASGNSQTTNPLQKHTTLSRSPSRVSAATAPKQIACKPSTLKDAHSRPSLGPPPSQLKKQPSRPSLPAPADEGFLSRMMRPTTSSASKTLEKSPPIRRGDPGWKDGSLPGGGFPKPVPGAAKIGVSVPNAVPKENKLASSLAPKRVEESQPASGTVLFKDERLSNKKLPNPVLVATKIGKPIPIPVGQERESVISSVSDKAKDEPKLVSTENLKPEIPQVFANAEETAGKESIPQDVHTENSVVEKPVTEETEGASAINPSPSMSEKLPKSEIAPNKPASVEALSAVTQEPVEKEETPAAVEEPAVPEEEHATPETTEDVAAEKEVIEKSNSEPELVPTKAVEVSIPEEVEAAQDPTIVKAPEEIAK